MSIREAVIMAAGVGKRLKPFTDTRPKSLLEVGGRSLMERHLSRLAADGVHRTTLVIGHCGDQIRARFGGRFAAMEIRYVENAQYARGSILSLRAGLDGVSRSAVCMDADVLYHPDVMKRLLASKDAACFLLDAGAEETGEEMMLGVKGGRVRKVARRVGKDWDRVGEGVGFFSVQTEHLPALRSILDDFVERGVVDVEYEDALNVFMERVPCGCIDVGDLPWTEIDFQEDLVKADRILARLRAMRVEP